MIQEKAYAKLNISLDVGRRRPDGYHDMTMVMQTVSLCDIVSIIETGDGKISAVSNMSFIPGDEKNLAVKAAKLFYEETGLACPGLEIRIEKNIPVGAGLAGGSADAAAVLRALNGINSNVLSVDKLLALAERAGSDVPFCLIGGTALATGRGEMLEELPPMPECFYLICKPFFSISTPELFKKLDSIKLRHHPDTDGIVSALGNGDLTEICRRMFNVFEYVNDRRMRTVAEIRNALLNADALGAVMTGTGSAVYGVFADRSSAEKAKEQIPGVRFTVVAENVPGILRT